VDFCQWKHCSECCCPGRMEASLT